MTWWQQLFRRRPRRLRLRAAHLRLGARGERLARCYLRQLGLEILATNYAGPHGELDIIARDGHILCFVEVKTRRHRRRSRPGEAVTAVKKQRLLRTAARYLRQLGHPSIVYRYDIVEVIMASRGHNEIAYLPNAFSARDLAPRPDEELIY